ncbi:MAG: bifunctional folylpolyglutamate synthase/dihydrofolate synthase, partial [Planctomycetaceae bacterium]|nr:bifunctional folylpolyglutamate synthase/dihydrofolate synthase [Planctomycetaceae bacterium]
MSPFNQIRVAAIRRSDALKPPSMNQSLPTRIDSYQDALNWLYARIDYEKERPVGQNNPFRLERIRTLLSLIGSPHERIPAVHIAGTKGKGSTAAMAESILRHSGYRTGLFTSPHIDRFEERLRVNGVLPNEQELTGLIGDLNQRLIAAAGDSNERPPTFFEVSTLLAWMYFDRHRVDVAILETGLGGRLDCTNVCQPLVTVITSIGLDHTHILGSTIAAIAGEKAGIIKPGVPVISGQLPPAAEEVVARVAAEHHCQRICLGQQLQVVEEASRKEAGPDHAFAVSLGERRFPELQIPLAGAHQRGNAAMATAAALEADHQLQTRRSTSGRITLETIRQGLRATRWPLRFEWLQTRERIPVLLDAAHN